MSEQKKLLIVISFPVQLNEEAIQKLKDSVTNQINKSQYDVLFVPEGVSVTNPPDFAELAKAINGMSGAVNSMCHEVAQSVSFGSQCLDLLTNDDEEDEMDSTHYLSGVLINHD